MTQILVYLDRCAEMVAKGKVVDSIYLDFHKALDTVPHRRFIKKLLKPMELRNLAWSGFVSNSTTEVKSWW